VWTGGRRRRSGLPSTKSRRLGKALREYWGPDADPLRVNLALEDSRFVTGVVQTVCDELRCSADDRRRVAAAATRARLLGEGDVSLARVDAAWRAWWPPDTSPESRERFSEFIGAWRAWLQDSSS
jgi:hypothetical protein